MNRLLHMTLIPFRIFVCVIFLTAAAAATVALPSQGTALEIADLRFGQHPGKTRMVLDLDRVSDYRVFTLESPHRIVIDLPRFKPSFDPGKFRQHSQGSLLIQEIRWGHLNEKISRFVIELEKTPLINAAFLLPARDKFPPRLVVDFSTGSVVTNGKAKTGSVFGTLNINDYEPDATPVPASVSSVAPSVRQASAAAHSAHARTSERTSERLAPAAGAHLAGVLAPGMVVPPAKPPFIKRKKPLIIIDPGHGGVDPGAIGDNGVFEKDIVLQLGLELRQQLEATGRYQIMMTRDDDRFLRLPDRVAFARRHKGDIFISLHADSLEKKNVSGASVYTLSENASDSQTARLARRENRADLIAGVNLNSEEAEVVNILIDLAMRDTMNQSSFFANTLVASMGSGKIKTLQNPHRFAGFAVLKAPDIPSVLIEAGFLSNPREAIRLSHPAYRKDIARTIVEGIGVYFERIERNRRS